MRMQLATCIGESVHQNQTMIAKCCYMITYILYITSEPCHINAQRYWALTMDLQSHGTQTMIFLRCHHIACIYLRHCLQCFFSNPCIFFFVKRLPRLLAMSSRALLRPKNLGQSLPHRACDLYNVYVSFQFSLAQTSPMLISRKGYV